MIFTKEVFPLEKAVFKTIAIALCADIVPTLDQRKQDSSHAACEEKDGKAVHPCISSVPRPALPSRAGGGEMMKRIARWSILAALSVALVTALATYGFAASVTPELIEGATNHTCAEFAGAGQTWTETKVDPPAAGNVTTSAGTITISNLTDTSFDWSATYGIDAVYVKSGSEGSNLYRYDPPSESTGDTGLTTPGSQQQISHISFCWDAEAPSSPSPSPSPSLIVRPSGGASPPTVLGLKLAATGATKPALPITGVALFALGALLVLVSNRPSRAAAETYVDLANRLEFFIRPRR
jgi:hypothetical protein